MYKLLLVEKIISGGQTGVDRAALDFAIEVGISHGGYCPKGRQAEDGVLPAKYHLIELNSQEYEDRTRKNVFSSDGTLILHRGIISYGTALTKNLCIQNDKPFLIINILKQSNLDRDDLHHWITVYSINVLNVAGARESEGEIYSITKKVLFKLLGTC